MIILPHSLLEIFFILETLYFLMMKENSAVKNPSVLFKPNSDSSQEDQKKLDITQSMTTSVLMMKAELFLTVLTT